MSLRPSTEQLADLRQDARLLIARTGDQQSQIEALAAASERDMHHAEAALTRSADLDVDGVRHLLRAQCERSTAGAATARQLCVNLYEQHDVARRLLAHLDGELPASARCSNTVLVVDDFPDICKLVAFVLGNAGFVVRTAANGLEGLIAAHQMRPGVIVMDVSMPVLDGIEATRLIKAGPATRAARVIAYTASPSFYGKPTEMLFAAVLQKPATPDDLLATVRHVAAL